MEARVYSGMGIPAIMFGRGDTANRSTGDNMTSELSDIIKAIQRTIEFTINDFIIKELLMEGGYDPVLNPDDAVFFKFKENELDNMIKAQNHAIYKFEHNAITEDEMRLELNMDPIADSDRAKLNREITAELTMRTSVSSESSSHGSGSKKETDNKAKPTNQHGTKSSSKKSANNSAEINLIDTILDELKT